MVTHGKALPRRICFGSEDRGNLWLFFDFLAMWIENKGVSVELLRIRNNRLIQIRELILYDMMRVQLVSGALLKPAGSIAE